MHYHQIASRSPETQGCKETSWTCLAERHRKNNNFTKMEKSNYYVMLPPTRGHCVGHRQSMGDL